MTFKYTVPRVLRPDPPTGATISRVTAPEILTGYVQGKKASDIEERMGKAFDKLGAGYGFRERLSPLLSGSRRLSKVIRNLPGELEIDFLVQFGVVRPIQVNGEIGHFMAPWQAIVDLDKNGMIDQFGAQLGWQPVVGIPFTDILTQDMADRVAGLIINGTYIPTRTT
jgi:hypothetical protein